jgi:hypothetical protein
LHLASAGVDGALKVWDVKGDSQVISIPASRGDRITLLSPNGQKVLTGMADNTIRLWDATTGQSRDITINCPDGILAFDLSPDWKRMPVLDASNKVTIWDLQTGKAVRAIENIAEGTSDLAASNPFDGAPTASAWRSRVTPAATIPAKYESSSLTAAARCCRVSRASQAPCGSTSWRQSQRHGEALRRGNRRRTARQWATFLKCSAASVVATDTWKSLRACRQRPAFGALTHEQWVQLHLRHAELHLSFVVPNDVPMKQAGST